MTIKGMIRLLILFSLVALLINCNRDKAINTADNTVDTLFAEFLGSIRTQSLPLQISCGLTDNLVSSEDFEKFKEYIPKNMDRVFGQIKSNNNNCKLIVYGLTGDDIYPFLFSYNNAGQVQDSLSLMLTGCGGADETGIPNAFASISQNLTIILTDTTFLIHYPGNWTKMDSLADDIDSVFVTTGKYIVDSVRISRKKIKIDDTGHFVEM